MSVERGFVVGYLDLGAKNLPSAMPAPAPCSAQPAIHGERQASEGRNEPEPLEGWEPFLAENLFRDETEASRGTHPGHRDDRGGGRGCGLGKGGP